MSQNNKEVMSSPGKTVAVENPCIFIYAQSSEIFHLINVKKWVQLISFFFNKLITNSLCTLTSTKNYFKIYIISTYCKIWGQNSRSGT